VGCKTGLVTRGAPPFHKIPVCHANTSGVSTSRRAGETARLRLLKRHQIQPFWRQFFEPAQHRPAPWGAFTHASEWSETIAERRRRKIAVRDSDIAGKGACDCSADRGIPAFRPKRPASTVGYSFATKTNVGAGPEKSPVPIRIIRGLPTPEIFRRRDRFKRQQSPIICGVTRADSIARDCSGP